MLGFCHADWFHIILVVACIEKDVASLEFVFVYVSIIILSSCSFLSSVCGFCFGSILAILAKSNRCNWFLSRWGYLSDWAWLPLLLHDFVLELLCSLSCCLTRPIIKIDCTLPHSFNSLQRVWILYQCTSWMLFVVLCTAWNCLIVGMTKSEVAWSQILFELIGTIDDFFSIQILALRCLLSHCCWLEFGCIPCGTNLHWVSVWFTKILASLSWHSRRW